MDNFYKQLVANFGKNRVLVKEPLSKHTYMKVGGPADVFFIARSSQELKSASRIAISTNTNYLIIGGGSNILVGDKGYRGFVIKNRADKISISKKGIIQQGKIKPQKSVVIAESGTLTNLLVRKTINEGLAGMEYFLGVPGTIGGAVFNNSHFQTEYVGNLVDQVTVLDKKGKRKTYSQKEMLFTYDHSILQKTREPILDIRFHLSPADPKILWEKATYYSKYRADSQPLEYPSSGCVFKNVENTGKKFSQERAGLTSAGYLIDQAGLKGTQVGKAMVSQKHASFIVNLGGATATDILLLIDKIKKTVKKKFGVSLEMEVFKVGEF